MPRPLAFVLMSVIALAGAPHLHAQRFISLGLAAGLPAANPELQHGMVTVEVGPLIFLSRFRADLTIYDGPTTGAVAQAAGSLIVPFIDRPLSPYFIAGLAFNLTDRTASPSAIQESARAGLGLRYRVGERTVFAESVRHWGVERALLTIGVQF